MTDNAVAAAADQRPSTMLNASNRPAIGATFAATAGLVFGPSTFLLFVFGVFVEPLSKTFGWSKPSILFAATIVSLMIMVVSPIQGYLIDRFGARPIVLSSCLAFALGLGGMYFLSSNISSFYIMYGLLPLLAIGLWPVSYLRVVSTWFERRLGLAIGVANGGIGLGAAMLPPILTYIILNGSVQWAYVSLGIIVLMIVLPINALFLFESPDVRPTRAGAAVAPQKNEEFKSLIRTQSFVTLTVAFFLLGFVNTGLVTNQISLLIDGGATPQQAAFVQAVFGLAVLVGRFLTGVLLDYVSAKRLMSAVCIGGAAACLLYALGPAGALVYLCAILIGMVYGAEFDVLSYIIKRSFGLTAFGRVYGTIFAVFQFGAALGATLLPLSRAHYESYAPGLVVYAGALIVSGLLLLMPGKSDR
ncbi:MFS transporter [Rhizobium bangladeshense]|uniref:MFS transporter n=1 Tax=Rhizobium bangladeshense TaxID=1138189 RepID=A0ABS7LKD9_9HYPH|nr:MFS transporter [Rhizobium bangladeshense]MBX4868707.1 MFS transporter [Rhizobium bangladeshense]MBX4873838.1 MFS transporter [Rhizobium bangladeshense]MBX4884848.1 MFS transporter [Rhizobium bangladeshense]MBY3591962.1 MFS transporter [Rhizobium bangladeshense]